MLYSLKGFQSIISHLGINYSIFHPLFLLLPSIVSTSSIDLYCFSLHPSLFFVSFFLSFLLFQILRKRCWLPDDLSTPSLSLVGHFTQESAGFLLFYYHLAAPYRSTLSHFRLGSKKLDFGGTCSAFCATKGTEKGMCS